MVCPEDDVEVLTGRAAAPGRRPVLVTGVPRSGTTWVARQLATSPAAAMPGREPMNPRSGQFGLGGTLSGWVRLEEPTAQQARLLRRCYAGLEPRTFSRYGSRQWAALLPGSRVVVKDPFALLSVPALVRTTGALPVVVYRHPGAVLSSYRRMGWTADVAEIRALQGRTEDPAPVDDAHAMVQFWTYLHEQVLAWLPRVPDALLVSHAELTAAGPAGMTALMARCGLPQGQAPAPSVPAPAGDVPEHGRLHQFDRRPEEVSEGWRSRVSPEEARVLDEGATSTWQTLESCRTSLR